MGPARERQTSAKLPLFTTATFAAMVSCVFNHLFHAGPCKILQNVNHVRGAKNLGTAAKNDAPVSWSRIRQPGFKNLHMEEGGWKFWGLCRKLKLIQAKQRNPTLWLNTCRSRDFGATTQCAADRTCRQQFVPYERNQKRCWFLHTAFQTKQSAQHVYECCSAKLLEQGRF